MPDLLIAVINTAAGYTLGRVQPLARLDGWLTSQLLFVGPWTTSRPRAALLGAVCAVARPDAPLPREDSTRA
ncbi:hypothetical protein [Streptomyces sp. URMC 124]|uniref:hypothetical protein n=1 Tax=Streptomyces sp. URMC 124 TaxID=3423405 RepID=UPI003F1997DC